MFYVKIFRFLKLNFNLFNITKFLVVCPMVEPDTWSVWPMSCYYVDPDLELKNLIDPIIGELTFFADFF